MVSAAMKGHALLWGITADLQQNEIMNRGMIQAPKGTSDLNIADSVISQVII